MSPSRKRRQIADQIIVGKTLGGFLVEQTLLRNIGDRFVAILRQKVFGHELDGAPTDDMQAVGLPAHQRHIVAAIDGCVRHDIPWQPLLALHQGGRRQLQPDADGTEQITLGLVKKLYLARDAHVLAPNCNVVKDFVATLRPSFRDTRLGGVTGGRRQQSRTKTLGGSSGRSFARPACA